MIRLSSLISPLARALTTSVRRDVSAEALRAERGGEEEHAARAEVSSKQTRIEIGRGVLGTSPSVRARPGIGIRAGGPWPAGGQPEIPQNRVSRGPACYSPRVAGRMSRCEWPGRQDGRVIEMGGRRHGWDRWRSLAIRGLACLLLGVVEAGAAGVSPTDPVQVFYPRGACETGILEIGSLGFYLKVRCPRSVSQDTSEADFPVSDGNH